MGKVDVYAGEYLLIETVTREEGERLAGAGAIIGMPVSLTFDAQDDAFRVVLPNGDSLGTVNPKHRLQLREALEEGWTISACLSLVFYNNHKKSFGGEICYQMFHVKPNQTAEHANLLAYTEKTHQRIAQGKRPDIALSGQGWEQVIATGDWTSDATQPMPIDTKRNSGYAVYKRKRNLADKLVMASFNKNPAPLIVAGIVLLAILAGLVYLVVRLIFG